MFASISSYGNIYVWTSNQEENWSAFAPDFKELEENLEYEEKEDEFDVVIEGTSSNSALVSQTLPEQPIDIISTIPQLQTSLTDLIHVPLLTLL